MVRSAPRTVCLGFALAVLALGAPAIADQCPIHVTSAMIMAVGATNRYAEYGFSVSPNPSTLNSISAFQIAFATGGMPDVVVDVPVALYNDQRSVGVALILKSAGVQSMRVEGVTDRQSSKTNPSDDTAFNLRGLDYKTSLQFDDAKPWFAVPPAVFEIVSPSMSTNRAAPLYPLRAQVDSEIGEVNLVIDLGGDGAVVGVEVAASSGNFDLDDAAIAAARKSAWKPVSIVTVAGDEPIPRRYHVEYTFSLSQ